MRRWLRDWDVFLAIMAVGVLTGVITFMAFDANPGACHAAVARAHAPVRSFTWVCSRP